MAKTALVVDDSMLMRYSISRFLEDRGFTVECAVNGSEALDAIARLTPDLIVTDMQMPKVSGSELITALKSGEKTAKVPIVVVAGKASGACEAEKRADFTIYKDIDIDAQLGKALDKLMPNASQGQAAGK